MSDESLASHLLQIGAVTLSPEQPFTWASGLRSPIYCDNRLTLSCPALRSRIAGGLVDRIAALSQPPAAVVGVATAGIPHATLAADRLDLPLAYVRSSAKKHGRRNQIEGRVNPGDPVVVIEDLISTGGSSLAAVEVLQDEGLTVLAVIGVFSYQLDVAVNRFRQANMPLFTLTNFEDLLASAEAGGLLSMENLQSLRAWRNNPVEWSGSFSAKD